MSEQVQYFRKLTSEIRDQKVDPPAALRDRFMAGRPKAVVRIFQWKRWVIAASVAVAISITWYSLHENNDSILQFPSGISVESFNGNGQSIDPHFRVDRNFYQLRKSYRKFNF